MLEEPYFIQKIPKQVEAEEGNDASIPVKVTGNPEPTVSWYKDGHLIADSVADEISHYSASSSIGQSKVIVCWNAEDGSLLLIVHDVEESDEGEYECRAHNEYGRASCFGQLVIRPCSPQSTVLILIDEGTRSSEENSDNGSKARPQSASEQIEVGATHLR
ncbi:Muscle M-line assembly protein unc-89 [Nymphon striatum]|nr:Muscle M-line assembly protein unc-89 [Nymphon striatum]